MRGRVLHTLNARRRPSVREHVQPGQRVPSDASVIAVRSNSLVLSNVYAGALPSVEYNGMSRGKVDE